MRSIAHTLAFLSFLILGTSSLLAQSETIANVSMSDPVNNLIKNDTPKEAAVMTVVQLKELQKEDPMLAILDIRDRESFEIARIYRAKHMGEEFTQEKVWMLKRNSNIVIYGDELEKNEEMCKRFLEKGFANVYYLNGTLGELELQGLEVTGDIAKSDKLAAKKIKKK